MNSRMKKNTNKTKQPNSNQMSSGSAPTKRGRTIKKAAAAPNFQGVPRLPSIFRAGTDATAVRLRSSLSIANSGSGIASYILALSPTTIGTAGYIGLETLFPILGGMRQNYSRFMVGRVKAQLFPITPVTAGGYVALGYDPTDTNISGPPSTLSDVVSSVHSDIAQVTEIAGIEFTASDYFNEWRQCVNASGEQGYSQAGVIQLICFNTQATTVSAAVLQLEFDIHFCGYRRS